MAYFEVANMIWRTSHHICCVLDFWTLRRPIASVMFKSRDYSELTAWLYTRAWLDNPFWSREVLFKSFSSKVLYRLLQKSVPFKNEVKSAIKSWDWRKGWYLLHPFKIELPTKGKKQPKMGMTWEEYRGSSGMWETGGSEVRNGCDCLVCLSEFCCY